MIATAQIGDATLICGDARLLVEALPARSAIVSDPPYGIGHRLNAPSAKRHAKAIRRNTETVLGDDTPFDPSPWLTFDEVVLWGANHFAARLPHGRWLAWDKLAGLPAYDSFSDVEFAWVKGRGKDRIFSHLWKGICRHSEVGMRRLHPTQKPVALMSWCIEQTRAPVIVDPHMGSGTTGIAAMRAGRRFIGIELDPGHFRTAVRRIEAEVAGRA